MEKSGKFVKTAAYPCRFCRLSDSDARAVPRREGGGSRLPDANRRAGKSVSRPGGDRVGFAGTEQAGPFDATCFCEIV